MSDREKPTPPNAAPPIDPELLAYLNGPPPQDENGVDLSLIDCMLDMTPAERVEWNYRSRLFIEKFRGAAARQWTR